MNNPLIFNTFYLILLVSAASCRCSDRPNVAELDGTKVAVAEGDARRDNVDERGNYPGGDMRLNEDQMEELKQGIVGSSYRWPGGKIPYVISSSFTSSELSAVQQGIAQITNKTCIKFTPRVSETNYVNIQRGGDGSGCWADVGMQYGKANTVNIMGNYASTCALGGIVAHELIHAIGFYHTQSRADRDSYVTINFNNIPSAYQYNFAKYTTAQATSSVAYDYDSIMHYSAYAFASNTAVPTITPTSSSVALNRLGQRNALSAIDAQMINAMYSGIC